MSDGKTYQHDVFISYTSADRPWALKLSNELASHAIETFIDRNRLEAGKPWESQLKEAVRNSRHLVALWSNNIKPDSWVHRELANFEIIVSDRGTVQGEQRLIFVNLEGQNLSYAPFQMIEDLKEAQVNSADINTLPADVWARVVKKVVTAIRSADATTPVPMVVLTATRDEMDKLPPDVWRSLQQDLGLTQAGLLGRYKEQRTNWQPFGGEASILSLLDKLVDDINTAVKEKKFHRELVGDDFWTSDKAAEEYRQRLISTVSLVVIDPIALHVDTVFRRLVRLKDCFESDQSVILVLPPFPPLAPLQKLRERMRAAGEGLFDNVLEPPVPLTHPLANCGVCLHDEADVKRVLRMTIGKHVLKSQPQPKPSYTVLGSL
jgi:hypothetical protein